MTIAAMPAHIEEGGLDEPDVIALLREHLSGMHALSPPESVHAFALERLRAPDVRFWTARDIDAGLLGCAALQRLDPTHAELKSMCTAVAHRGRGVGAALLAHVLDAALRDGVKRVSLETGTAPAFAPAHRLYARFGFAPCGPFAAYAADPHSCFMTRVLPAPPTR